MSSKEEKCASEPYKSKIEILVTLLGGAISDPLSQLGNKNSRNAVDERVGRSQPGQSFLARQRQQTQQRRNQARSVQSGQKRLPGAGGAGATRKETSSGGLFSR